MLLTPNTTTLYKDFDMMVMAIVSVDDDDDGDFDDDDHKGNKRLPVL